MPRINVTTQPITRAGVEPELLAPTVDGDVIDTGDVALWVDNAGASPSTVEVPSPITYDGLALAPLTVVVPAGGFRMIGPLPARTFAQPADATEGANRALVNYTNVTGLTRAVVKL